MPTSLPSMLQVYNVTEFLDEHPGGFDIILTNTGGSHLYSEQPSAVSLTCKTS